MFNENVSSIISMITYIPVSDVAAIFMSLLSMISVNEAKNEVTCGRGKNGVDDFEAIPFP